MIEKKTASEIYNLGGTYTVLPNKSINMITCPLTLGVWAGLIQKDKDWSIRQPEVCERFGISKRQYYSITSHLKKIDLMREYTKRNNQKLLGKTLVVVSSIDDWTDAEKRLDTDGKAGKYYLTRSGGLEKLGHDFSVLEVNDSSVSCEFPKSSKTQNQDAKKLTPFVSSPNVTRHDRVKTQNAPHINKRDIEMRALHGSSHSHMD